MIKRTAFCGHDYQAEDVGIRRKAYGDCWCDPAKVRAAEWEQFCSHCDSDFYHHQAKSYCSAKCRRSAEGRVDLPTEAKCRVCSGLFTPIRRNQRSCSNSCAQKWYKANHRKPEEWNDRRRANYQKRRALKAKVPSDSIRSLEVFERDGWMCGICGLQVDPAVKWPDPRSPSLDHIIPLSRGGHHVESNTQLACLECNVAKGDRLVET